MTHALARDAIGIGLRPIHFDALRAGLPSPIGFFEIIAENFLGKSDLPLLHLDAIAALGAPIVAHNVSLNLLGVDPLDTGYLRRLKALLDRYRAPCCTDHLAWTASEGVSHHDLLPAPCAESLVPWAIERVRAVQHALDGVPFGIENPSTYLRFRADDMPEWEFLRRIVDGADCGVLLDVNNVAVSSRNHGFDPREYLHAVPWHRVLYVHLAGHQVRADGLRHDTHDRAVSDEVWALYEEAWSLGGPFPTLLEWDDRIPPLDLVVTEAARALVHRSENANGTT